MGQGKVLESLLLPAGWIYGCVTWCRNRLFDSGILRSRSFPVPVISVGNITVGGTGKTPHTEYLIDILKDNFRLAVLSRGYGRRTKGYILAESSSDARQIGDEPMQIHSEYPDIAVAVCEDRCKGIECLMSDVAPQVIILDDAFQHRKVVPSLNILLVDWNRNIMNDRLLPSGRLREPVSGRRRADMVIVTKCPPGLDDKMMDSFRKSLKLDDCRPLFFSRLVYGNPYAFAGSSQVTLKKGMSVLMVTGIARPEMLRDELERSGLIVRMLTFPDHHAYTMSDIAMISETVESMPDDAVIVTTRKDQSRLQGMDVPGSLASRIVVMPVSVEIENDGERFRNLIESHVRNMK